MDPCNKTFNKFPLETCAGMGLEKARDHKPWDLLDVNGPILLDMSDYEDFLVPPPDCSDN